MRIPDPSFTANRPFRSPSVVPFVIVLVSGAAFAFAAPGRPAAAGTFVPGRLLIKFKSSVDDSQKKKILEDENVQEEGSITPLGIELMALPAQADEGAVLNSFRQRAEVEFAELDSLLPPEAIPNDPYYSSEWHLPVVSGPTAWETTTGSPNVIIAILDSGCDPTHPDLAPQYVPGWNIYNNNSNTSDVHGHGTAVAGTAAAASGNANGVASLAWGCRIMPIRVTDTSGSASLSALASGLTWAADHGARVANISFMASNYATVTTGAQYFENKGGVVTVSAGNYSTFDSTADNRDVLTVSASNSSDAIASFSNTGNNIDLAAPGDYIYTTNNGGGYGQWSGTSFSAPAVAGVAALVISANPTLSSSQIQTVLKNSADDLGSQGWDSGYGWGRVNAARAVALALTTGTRDTTLPTVSIASPASGASVSGSVSVQVSASDNVSVAWLSLMVDGTLAISVPSPPYTFSWNTVGVPNGSHTLQAVARDPAGNTRTSSVQVTVNNAVGTPPILVSAASRKIHGAAGPIDIALPLASTTGLEPRSGGLTQLILNFNQTVHAADGVADTEVSVSSGSVTGISVNGSVVTVTLAGSGDGCVGITVAGWASASGLPLSSPVTFTARSLVGDVNGSSGVTLTDAIAVQSHSGQAANVQTGLYDLDLSGLIDMGDALLAKSAVTHAISCPP
jgi:thermitase